MVAKLSAIATSGGNPALTDYLVGVSAANVDLKYTLTQVSAGIGSAAFTVLLAPASNASIDGLILSDTTAAPSSGNQQYSPRLRLTGQGWKTNATAGSQAVDWIAELQPVEGAANPSALLRFSAQINGGGYTPLINFNSLASVSRPNLYFNNDNSTGIWQAGSGLISVSIAAVERVRVGSTITLAAPLQVGGTVASPFMELVCSAANTIGLVAVGTTTNPTALYVYNTTDSDTSPANYERGIFDWKVTPNALTIGTVAAGTGTARNMQFVIGGTNKLDFGITTAATWTASVALASTAALTAYSGTAIPAGGTAGAGHLVSSTANFGMFFGSGAPTLSAAKGSLYLRSDGTTTNDRAYINSNGSTTWTALTTAA